MIHLNHINIRNTRRFGENVDIDFGKGATILLAPNGTGKTTVFEAIELALTGKLERVGEPPNALIRDQQSGLDIQLKYSNDLICQVAYQLNKDLVLKGDHDKLFGDKIDSIPYLLRLTHLLEQRGKDWFVGAKEKDAGSRLDKLSIGRELNNILAKKQSITGALTKEQKRLEDKLSKSKEILDEFKALLARKSQLQSNVDRVPLSEIISQLNNTCKNAKLDIKTKAEDNVDSVAAFLEQIKSAVNQLISNNLSTASQYAELDSFIQLYSDNLKILETKTKEQGNNNVALSEKEKSRFNSQESFDRTNEQLQNREAELDKLKEIRNLFSENDIMINEVTSLKKEINEQEEIRKRGLEDLKKVEDAIEKTNKIFDAYRFIDNDIEKNENEKSLAAKLWELQKRWEQTSSNIKEIQEVKIPLIEKDKMPLEEALLTLNESFANASAVRKEKERVLKSLRQASGDIQQAVSTIASNISDAATDCPVCEAKYNAGELKDRITSALNKINPLISIAVEEESVAIKDEANIKKTLDENKSALDKTNADLQAQKNLLTEYTDTLEKIIIPNFPNCKSAFEASRFIDEKEKKANEAIESLVQRKASLEQKPTEESLNESKLRKAELERLDNIHEEKIKASNLTLVNKEQSLKDLMLKIENESVEKNNADITSVQKSVDEIKNRVRELTLSKETLEKEIKELKNQIIECTEFIAKVKSQQDGIQNKWSSAKLENYPVKDSLDEAKKSLSEIQNNLNAVKIELEKIDQEISRWRSAESYLKVVEEIKTKIAPDNEEVYLERLNSQVISDGALVKDFVLKHKTFTTFFANAKKEQETIHKHITAINPSWTKLLKRIVVDSRFSDGELLSSGTYRNRTYANIKTALHNNPIDVTSIASEAQLTDLQLTFMLAMAKKHQWTPWKALLLDDPTQHHDLVHASAVFDVLRDYIVDMDFQIMMSTHDSTQANFFYRKLQNDGIEAKIYRLNAARNGVVAERLK